MLACDRREMSQKYLGESMSDLTQGPVREDSSRGLCPASIHQYSLPFGQGLLATRCVT